MNIRGMAACVLLALAPGGAFAQETPVDVVPAQVAAANCPRKGMQPPRYPPEAFMKGVTGKVMLSLAVDECGRVLDARIAKGSGSKALDKASIEAAKGWVLGPTTPEARAKMVDGRIETPTEFKLGDGSWSRPTPRNMGWPSTHKRPRYVLEPGGEFPSVEAAEETARAPTERSYPPPYDGLPGSFLATGTKAQPEFWLLPFTDGRIDLAVRYRPVMENGEPVVRLLVVCAKPPAMCATDESFLMKGLPFAKASNP
jgi:TonB family protein